MHPGLADDLPVDDPDPVFTDCAHAQLALEWRTELADDNDIQRRAQRPGHLQRDGDTASRQAKHDHRLVSQVFQPRSQPLPRIHAVDEKHDNPH